MPFAFDVRGFAEVVKNLRQSAESYVGRLDENIYTALEEVTLSRVRAETPVRTGRTRKGWRLKHVRQFEYIIENRTPYAAFIPRRGDNERFGTVAVNFINRQFNSAVRIGISRTPLRDPDSN